MIEVSKFHESLHKYHILVPESDSNAEIAEELPELDSKTESVFRILKSYNGKQD